MEHPNKFYLALQKISRLRIKSMVLDENDPSAYEEIWSESEIDPDYVGIFQDYSLLLAGSFIFLLKNFANKEIVYIFATYI